MKVGDRVMISNLKLSAIELRGQQGTIKAIHEDGWRFLVYIPGIRTIRVLRPQDLSILNEPYF